MPVRKVGVAAKPIPPAAQVGKSSTKAKSPTKTKINQNAPLRAARARSAKGKAAGSSYLAAELGQPVDKNGEPIGAGSTRVQSDRALQEYALQLWRQMQRGSLTKNYMRSIERAGLTIDEVWTAGIGEAWPTASTPDEMRRYQKKLLFRANLLEAILSETVADLHRLEGIEPTASPPSAAPTPSEAASEPV